MPPPPPHLMDELVEEVLLRLPPDSPASLVRAGLVCKRWCRLVSDPGFQRRFLELHRAPPVLGFLVSFHFDSNDVFYPTRFVPTSASGGLVARANAMTHDDGLIPSDSRHGRVLVHDHTAGYGYDSSRVIVWNPITGDQRRLPKLPPWDPYVWTTAVVCAAAAACDHVDCHYRGRPFVVVLVGTRRTKNFVCIYDSEAGAWGEPAFAPHSGGSIEQTVRSALVGNRLYFVLHEDDDNGRPCSRLVWNCRNILEYNLGTREVSVIKLPKASSGSQQISEPFGPIELTTMEDGRLGFVRVENCYSRLCVWSRDQVEGEEASSSAGAAAAGGGGGGGWVLRKAIELKTLVPFYKMMPLEWECAGNRLLAGSAEGVSTIFLTLKDGLFMVDLRSGRVTKVYAHPGVRFTVPYVNFFCTRTPS